MRTPPRTSAVARIAALLLGLTACDDITGTGAREVASLVRDEAHPLTGAATDYAPLLSMVGPSRFVLLGESTHGTHEFYEERARISLLLAEERDFAAVAVEGDWPDAERVNRYVRGQGTDAGAEAALGDFDVFPRWMWRNAEVRDFVEALRERNASVSPEDRVGFYGLDVYSLYPSIRRVLEYLGETDPAAAQAAERRYACFSRWSGSAEAYGFAVARNPEAACTEEADEQLAELRRRSAAAPADEALFDALQNARVVRNAEEYFRVASGGGGSAWNVRDRHMAETLEALSAHLRARGASGKVVVWAHNTHVGDHRATQLGEGGELNLGQLVRERFPGESVHVGFTTYTGTVIAASAWGGAPERKRVRPALEESYAALFHRSGLPAFLLPLRDTAAGAELRGERLERAIGVLYLPETERQSHYFTARLAHQFDAVIHFDETTAVTPLD